MTVRIDKDELMDLIDKKIRLPELERRASALFKERQKVAKDAEALKSEIIGRLSKKPYFKGKDLNQKSVCDLVALDALFEHIDMKSKEVKEAKRKEKSFVGVKGQDDQYRPA